MPRFMSEPRPPPGRDAKGILMNSSVHHARALARAAAVERHRRLAQPGTCLVTTERGGAGAHPAAAPRRAAAVSR
jgi:hypothetical protein